MIVPKIASATIFETIASSVVNKIAAILSYILGWLGSQVVILEGTIIDWLVNHSQFTKLFVVQTGWGIARDVANLFFIGILIYIAFGTILRLEKFNTSKLLFNLVLFAILINFSLTISGIIIDFSQALFKFFIFAPIKGEFELSPQLANALSLQNFWAPGGSATQFEAYDFTLSETMLKALAQIILTVIFTFITVIVFGAMIAILFIRNIYLWTLLILAPIAWICGIVPLKQIRANAGKWWDQFIKWATVAPVLGFFIFLALLAAQGRAQLTGGFETTSPGGMPNDLFRDNFNPVNIFQFVAIIGLMIAGLIAAEAFGAKTAGAARGMIEKRGKAIKGWMQRQGTKGAGAVGGGALAGISKAASKIPFVGGLLSQPISVAGRNLQARGEIIKESEREKAKKRIAHIKSLDELSNTFPTLTGNEQIAAINKAMKVGKMPDNMKDVAMKLAAKGEINKMELLKIDATLRPEWQEPSKKISELNEKRRQSFTTNKPITAIINGIMKAGKMPDNMKDVAMRLALQGEIDKRELLKIEATLSPEWQESLKKISALNKEREELEAKNEKDPYFVEIASSKKEALEKNYNQIASQTSQLESTVAKSSEKSSPAEINKIVEPLAKISDGSAEALKKNHDQTAFYTKQLESNVAKTFEKSSPTEISKTIASIDINKIPVALKDAIINNMADDPAKYNSSVVMGIVGQKPIAEKASFVETLLRARMNRVKNAANLTDVEKLDALKNSDPTLIKRLNGNSGLKQLDATFNNFYDEIKAASAAGPTTGGPTTGGSTTGGPSATGPTGGGPIPGGPTAGGAGPSWTPPPPSPPSPPPSPVPPPSPPPPPTPGGWQPPSPPPPRKPPEWTPPSPPPPRSPGWVPPASSPPRRDETDVPTYLRKRREEGSRRMPSTQFDYPQDEKAGGD